MKPSRAKIVPVVVAAVVVTAVAAVVVVGVVAAAGMVVAVGAVVVAGTVVAAAVVAVDADGSNRPARHSQLAASAPPRTKEFIARLEPRGGNAPTSARLP